MARSLIFAPALGALMLVACGDNDARTPQPPIDEAESAAPLPDAPPVGAGWSMVSSGEGVALRLEEGGDLIAAVACTRDPAGLRKKAEQLRRKTYAECFTIGAGDEAYAMAADLEAERERGVEASGDIHADLLDRIEAGGEIAFNYGAQNLGPFPAVPEADRDAFLAECREIAG